MKKLRFNTLSSWQIWQDNVPEAALSSARAQLPEYRFYGAAALRRSRDGAAALTACILVLSAAGLFAVTAGRVIPTLPPAPPAVMFMRVESSSPLPASVQEEHLRKILAEDSEFELPTPPEPEKPLPEPPPLPKQAPPPPPVPKPEPKPEPKPQVQPKAEPQKESVPAAPPAKAKKSPRESAAVKAPAGELSGTAGESAAATERRKEGELRNQILARLIAEIEKRKSYPRQARRTGAEGTCTLEIRVDSSGVVQAGSVAEGSGSTVLDAATSRLGAGLVGLDTGVRGKAFRILVPVTYSLRK